MKISSAFAPDRAHWLAPWLASWRRLTRRGGRLIDALGRRHLGPEISAILPVGPDWTTPPR